MQNADCGGCCAPNNLAVCVSGANSRSDLILHIADFFCPAAKLIVELDGDHHGLDSKASYDAIRTRWLEGRGYKVLRFANRAVLKEPILEMIWHEAQSRLPLPERPSAVRPSLKGRVG